jgi:hypothetical protein
MHAQKKILDKYQKIDGSKTVSGQDPNMTSSQVGSPHGNFSPPLSTSANGGSSFFPQSGQSKTPEPEDPYLDDRLEAYNSPEFVKSTTDTFPKQYSSYNQ